MCAIKKIRKVFMYQIFFVTLQLIIISKMLEKNGNNWRN